MAEILLVNPRKRKRKSASRRKNPRRRMSAKQARYFGKGRRRRSVAVSVKANPRRRRRVARVVSRRRRRNPSVRGITGRILPTVQNGFVGALGGLGLDVLTGFALPKLPAMVQTGIGKTAFKVLSAVLVGYLGGMVKRGWGSQLANGAMTIVLHDALKEQIAANFPNLPLGEYLTVGPEVGYDFQPALPGSTGVAGYGEDWSSGMGAYMTGSGSGMDTFDEG